MTWFKVDDGFHTSPKLQSIPARHRFQAAGLWVVAGSWSSQQMTDGFVPDYMIEAWKPTRLTVESLVNAGLWERVRGGFEFRSWLEYNPSKQQTEDKRAADAERKQRNREKKRRESAGSSGESENVTVGHSGASRRDAESVRRSPGPTRPDPTRPGPKEEGVTGGGSVTASRAGAQDPPSEIPPEWVVDPRRARCAVHAGMDNPPACGACADARRAAEGARSRQADAERDAARERRETRDACDLCDPNGLVRVGGRLTRCPHDPDRLASMQAAAEEAPEPEEPPVGTPGYETPAALTDWRRKWRNRTQLLDGETRLPAIEHDPDEIR